MFLSLRHYVQCQFIYGRTPPPFEVRRCKLDPSLKATYFQPLKPESAYSAFNLNIVYELALHYFEEDEAFSTPCFGQCPMSPTDSAHTRKAAAADAMAALAAAAAEGEAASVTGSLGAMDAGVGCDGGDVAKQCSRLPKSTPPPGQILDEATQPAR